MQGGRTSRREKQSVIQNWVARFKNKSFWFPFRHFVERTQTSAYRIRTPPFVIIYLFFPVLANCARWTFFEPLSAMVGGKMRWIFVRVWLASRENNYQVCPWSVFKTSSKWNDLADRRFCDNWLQHNIPCQIDSGNRGGTRWISTGVADTVCCC